MNDLTSAAPSLLSLVYTPTSKASLLGSTHKIVSYPATSEQVAQAKADAVAQAKNDEKAKLEVKDN